MDFDNIDLKDGVLIIKTDEGIKCIPEEGATEEEKVLFEEFKAKYPNGKAIIISLDEAKVQKIVELSNKCNETILAGFYSDADGEMKLYDFELENQVNLSVFKSNILLSRLSDNPLEKVSYYAKGEKCHDYTADQFLNLVSDAEIFKFTNITKYKDILKPMVESCTNVEEVDQISWDIYLEGSGTGV